MTGPKTNEGATEVGERTGTRARVRYVRSSAYKAREVLNLIRGMDVRTADETLQLVERDIAIVIRKALASAVANAANNDHMSPDELYVSACYADEGPTLKRFRPRARGRAFRIRKRTCHITVLVARLPERRLEQLRRTEAAKPAASRGRRGGASAAASRRERVARSRKSTAAPAHDHDHDHGDHEHGDDAAVESLVGDLHPYGEGSHAPLDDGSMPAGYEIKGNAQSMLYHAPGTRYYTATKAEAWFATEEAAEAAGFSKPGSQTDDAAERAEGSASDEPAAAEPAAEGDE